MGLRFRKSISICPGVRLNFGKSGFTSVSVGPRGASLSMGKRGTYTNVGIPGSGLSYRTRIGGNDNSQNNRASIESTNSELLQQLQQFETEIFNILNIHLQTPNLQYSNTFSSLKKEYIKAAALPFAIEAPIRPVKPLPSKKPELKKGWFNDLFTSKSVRETRSRELRKSIIRWESQNLKDETNYVQRRSAWALDYSRWQKQKEQHEKSIKNVKVVTDSQFKNDNDYFEDRLAIAFGRTEWARETRVSFEVDAPNSLVRLDVDLPEIEDIPNINYRLNRRGNDVLTKEKSAKQLRLEYARLVHGTIFRLAGIVFFELPFKYVQISGFTQRVDKSTGYIIDDYIIKVKLERALFSSTNFSQLDLIDPIVALEKHQLTRKMTTTGIFKSLK